MFTKDTNIEKLHLKDENKFHPFLPRLHKKGALKVERVIPLAILLHVVYIEKIF
jgi:hypothetical protein